MEILNNIREELLPYKQSVDLKNLGFNEECFGFYNETGGWCPASYSKKEIIYPKNSDLFSEWASSPTLSQTFKWIRKKHGMQHHIWSGKINNIFYGYDVLNIEKQEFIINNSGIGGEYCGFNTYEEAEFECIKNLIELIKFKQ